MPQLDRDRAEIVENARAFAGLGVETLVISANTGDPGEARSWMAMIAREVLPVFQGEDPAAGYPRRVPRDSTRDSRS